MSIRWAIVPILVLGACGEKVEVESDSGDPKLEPYDSGTPASGIVPEFVGVSVQMAIDETGEAATYRVGTSPLLPSLVILNFVTSDYFLQTSQSGRDAEGCRLIAEVVGGTLPLGPTEEFPNDDGVDYFQAYDFELVFDPAGTDCPEKVDEATFGPGGAELVDRWAGATVGIAIAPVGSIPDLADVSSDLLDDGSTHLYAALKQPDGTYQAFGAGIGETFEYDLDSTFVNPLNVVDVTGLDPAKARIETAGITSTPLLFRSLSLVAEDLTR